MKRAEKIALLTNVLHSSTTNAARKRLEQAVANAPRSFVLIDDLFYTGSPLTDMSLVTCQINGQHHTIQLGEASQYARCYGVRPLVLTPVHLTTPIN